MRKRAGAGVCHRMLIASMLLVIPATAAAAEPASEPVRESVQIPSTFPDTVERLPEKTDSIENLLKFARYDLGKFQKWHVVHLLEACLDRAEPTPPAVYLDLAIAYLSFGRFDAAIAVLEKGQREVAAGNKSQKYFPLFIQHATNVKTTLTQARNSLRQKGTKVTHPDERIFLAAFAHAAPNDDYLILNLADAYAGAFPESPTAMRCLAEMNLGRLEQGGQHITVPGPRGKVLIYRGHDALEKFHALDKDSPYPAIRLMQHVLLTTSNPDPGRTVLRDELPRVVSIAFRDLDQNPNFTNQQKAYLHYGKAMFDLKGPSWGNAIAYMLIPPLESAVRLDPDSKLYSDTLAWVRANQEQINRTKMQAREREDARAQAQATAMFGQLNSRADPNNTRGAQIVGAMWTGRGVWRSSHSSEMTSRRTSWRRTSWVSLAASPAGGWAKTPTAERHVHTVEATGSGRRR
jgi:tetratricopeptide (TPR) repeat protein